MMEIIENIPDADIFRQSYTKASNKVKAIKSLSHAAPSSK